MTAPFKVLLTGLLAFSSGVIYSGAGDAVRLGTQQCNTECQERFTDCVDRCDGVLSCQKECKRVVEECVKACTDPPPAPSGSSKPPGKPAPSVPSSVPPRPSGAPPPKPAPSGSPAKPKLASVTDAH